MDAALAACVARRAMWGVVRCCAVRARDRAAPPMSERVYPEARAQQIARRRGTRAAQGRLDRARRHRRARVVYRGAGAGSGSRRSARRPAQASACRDGRAARRRTRNALKKRTQRCASRANSRCRAPRSIAIAERLRQREADARRHRHLLADAEAAHVAGRLDGDARCRVAALPAHPVVAAGPQRRARRSRRCAVGPAAAGAGAPGGGKFDRSRRDRGSRARIRRGPRRPARRAGGAHEGRRPRAHEGTRALRNTSNSTQRRRSVRAALALDPQDSAARDGLQRVAVAWARAANTRRRISDFDDAEAQPRARAPARSDSTRSPTPNATSCRAARCRSACRSRRSRRAAPPKCAA
jgi:hypothetical protein